MATRRSTQQSLFAEPPRVSAAFRNPEYEALASRLPREVRLGTMSWSFPGWRGCVYSRESDAKQLAAEGLPAYTKHPLLRAVEIDRSFYEPLGAAAFSAWRSQVPDDFRFVVKAHEDCTSLRFPAHPRYGKKGAQQNTRFLDASYATDAVVGPVCEGLGEKLALLRHFFLSIRRGSCSICERDARRRREMGARA